MQQFFLIIHVLAAVTLVGLVLLQQGRGADAGAAFGSGASGTLFGARGPASFLTRITAILAAVFFLTSIGLAYMVGHSEKRESVVRQLRNEPAPSDVEKDLSVPPAPLAPQSGITGSPETTESLGPQKASRDIPAPPATEGPAAAGSLEGNSVGDVPESSPKPDKSEGSK